MKSTEDAADLFARLAEVMEALDVFMAERERERQEIVRSIPVYWSDGLGCYVTVPEE